MCSTWMEARGLAEGDMITGAARFAKDELPRATLAGDRELVF